jgi:signal transduction histidine kinase/AmiR/NasT family two-component response regulator
MTDKLVAIGDIDGFFDAVSQLEFTYALPGLQVPDRGLLLRITIMARRVDDEPLARRAFEANSRLIRANPTASSLANLAIDCAELEANFQYPAKVLSCLKGVDLDVVEPKFRKVVGLSVRARALAQMGQTDLAEADLAELDRLKASGEYHPGSFAFMPLAKAQVLANRGRSVEAFQIVSQYWRAAAKSQVIRFRDAVPALVGILRADVVELRKTAELQKTVIALQSLIAGLAIAVALAAGYAVYTLRKLNRKLDAARLAAEEANQAKSQFLANISHEIRTPLNGVLGLAQAISADELSPVQAERIGVLRQSGLGLLAILNDLLDLAKIEAGKLTIEAVPFNPQEVLTAARQAIWATAEAKGLTVETTVMPEAEGLYKGDPTRLRQIIDNLVSNAVKFTPTGRVDVVLSRPADALVLTVADTGIGMTPEATIRIFTKFEQADASTTRRFGGSGLGLSICLELAEAMGGAIKADSVEGQGTTFTVILPLERLGDVQDVVAVQAVDAVVDADQPLLRVLAAEDHPVNQLVLRTLLGQFGVEVTMASNGQEVLDLFKNHDWDVVLMDVQMPVMDGPTATRAIRQFERDQARRPTPILALTANAMAHQLDDYRQAGCNGHVSKPIDATDLISAMSRVLAEAEDVTRSEVEAV